MNPHIPTGRGHMIAYAISAFSTLLWAGCVMPAGFMVEGVPAHHSSPMSREAWLLVPALLLLIVGPVGVVLSRTRRGLAAVLASTDAFVAVYMAVVLAGWGAFVGTVSGILVGLLFGLGILSVIEVIRLLRIGPGPAIVPYLRGLRLALCLLALLTPSWILVQEGRELASLLIPYAIIAIGAGGAALARTETGLRLTTAVLHLAFAIHLFVVLRYTIYDRAEAGKEAILSLRPFGWFTLGVSVFIVFLALLQVIRLLRHVYFESARQTSATNAAPQG
jgi:hypothetical protein